MPQTNVMIDQQVVEIPDLWIGLFVGAVGFTLIAIVVFMLWKGRKK